jgi:hypothetical protein
MPGPAAYDLDRVSLSKSGHYVMSKYKNPGSPSLKSRLKEIDKKGGDPGPDKYLDKTAINSKGVYYYSKHKCSLVRSFGKEERPSMAKPGAALVPGPGFYPAFSEFGRVETEPSKRH